MFYVEKTVQYSTTMLKILHRYILRQYMANLVLGIFIFTFVLLLDRLFELVDLLINKGVGLYLTAKLLFFLVPSTFSLTLPIAILLGVLLTFGHMSETNEVTAVRASGVSPAHFLFAPLGVALAATLFLIPFNSVWAPHAHSHFRTLYLEVLQRNPLVQIEEKTFADIGEYHLYVEHKSRKAPQLRGVTIYKISPGSEPLRIYAENGDASVDPSRGMTLNLHNGHIEEIDTVNPNRWFYTSFENYMFFIPFHSQNQATTRAIEEMDSGELTAQIAKLKKAGLPYPIFSCQKYLRLALAITPVLFVLLGIPLGVRVRHGGTSIGFGMSVLLIFVYYVITMGGLSAGQRGILPAALSVSFGNLVVLILGVILTWRFLRQ
jgi:lipopolysaccharide export system permease protein